MIKEKFNEFLKIMELFLTQQGYQKTRKKGTYHKVLSGKIIKIRMVLSSVRGKGNLGEIRAFCALEYPELEKIVSKLKEEEYKKGNDLFSQDIALFCGERIYYSLNFSCDSNMEYIGLAMIENLVEYVFPILQDYEDDEKILHIFASDAISWRSNYFSGGNAKIDFYIRWASLCVLCGYVKEAFLILDNIPCYYKSDVEDAEIKVIKKRLGALCSDKEQVNAFSLLFDENIIIKPKIEEIKKSIIHLDGLKKYFLILENYKQKTFLQIAGGSGEFIIEIKLDDGQEDERHYRAETKVKDRSIKRILYGGTYLSIQTCQVMSINHVCEIVSKYFIDQGLHSDYDWIKLAL